MPARTRVRRRWFSFGLRGCAEKIACRTNLPYAEPTEFYARWTVTTAEKLLLRHPCRQFCKRTVPLPQPVRKNDLTDWHQQSRRLQASLVKWVCSATSALRRTKLLGWPRAGVDLVYPPQCVACGHEFLPEVGSTALCVECRHAIEAFARPYCRRCGIGDPVDGAGACRRCSDRRFRFSRVVRLGPYENELRSFVLRMKHVSDEPLSSALGNLLGAACELDFGDAGLDWLAPVPMFWRRRMRRQTSSAEILAAAVGKRLGVPVYHRALSRTRNTRSQGDLPPGERRANVRDAFRLRRPNRVADTRVLVIDDVLTTGATCNEVARILRRAGAREVSVAVVARTESPFV